MSIHKYGWKRGLPDFRRKKYSGNLDSIAVALPPLVDMRSQDSPVYDQGNLNACTGNAIAGMCQFMTIKLKKKWLYTPSRLFIYYNERVIEGDVSKDDGATLTDGMTVVNTQGAPNEKNWEYVASKFAVKPPASVYTNGLEHLVGNYYEVDNTQLTQLQTCLAAGFPFVMGFVVYESFESDAVANTGIVPMPKKNESQLGGHAVMCLGYDTTNKWVICRNSWGSGWGAAGYFYLPFSYVTSPDLADEFFTMRTIG